MPELWSPTDNPGCAGHGECNLAFGHVYPDGRPVEQETPGWVRESVDAMADFTRAMHGLVTSPSASLEEYEGVKAALLALAPARRSPTSDPTTLVSAALPGEYTVFLADPVPDGCVLLIAPGTPRWMQIRVYECTGTGPYEAWLGLDVNNRTRLGAAFPAGTLVEICDAAFGDVKEDAGP